MGITLIIHGLHLLNLTANEAWEGWSLTGCQLEELKESCGIRSILRGTRDF